MIPVLFDPVFISGITPKASGATAAQLESSTTIITASQMFLQPDV